ncbi:MAG: RNA methyltransferase [Gammaproteobacteria bacterium]|nr:RNA methyltransferase [Gammaproteobacteria bacterium]
MSSRRPKYQSRGQAMLRYEKQRKRNCLAVPGAHEFIVVLDHLKAGFNVPKIFRSCEAFGGSEVDLINIGPFDPAPGKGAFKKVPARFYEDFDTCYRALKQRGYTLFALEAGMDELLAEVELPLKSAFIFGHEEMGLSFSVDDYPEIRRISIPQWGVVESLNVSVAASIVMYEYIRRHG